MSIYDLTAYEVLQQEDLSDLKSKGTRMMMRIRYLRSVSVRLRPTAQEFRILWNIRFCADRGNFR